MREEQDEAKGYFENLAFSLSKSSSVLDGSGRE
jgi:hypothetical protein